MWSAREQSNQQNTTLTATVMSHRVKRNPSNLFKDWNNESSIKLRLEKGKKDVKEEKGQKLLTRSVTVENLDQNRVNTNSKTLI